MKKIRGGRLALSILSILLVLAITSCVGGGDAPAESATGGTEATEPEETVYEPVIDADADSLDGITIRSADDLAKIGTDAEHPLNGKYYLVIDIDLSGREWTPIGGANGQSGVFMGQGVFCGYFDGRGHTISGLTINASGVGYTSYWGLFGSVGGRDEYDPTVIKDITFSNVSINLSSYADTGVGTLAGQVNGSVEISGISLLSGSVSYSGSGNLGCGGLIGQCRTQRLADMSNEFISITDIFSNVKVSSQNSGWDTGAGIIGRIRDSSLGRLANVVLVADAVSEGMTACAIATGDSTAAVMENLYFLNGTGVARDGLGKGVSEEKMTDGSLSLASTWTVNEGSYPLLTAVAGREGFSLMDLAVLEFASGESSSGVRSAFSLPTTVLGHKITWTSENESVISVSGTRANVTQPEQGHVNVKLIADFGVGMKEFVIRVLGKLADGLYFITGYIEADKPIEVGGYDAGATFTWKIENYADGTTRTETTEEPKLTLGKNDSESLVTVSTEGSNPISIYYSALPVVYIDSGTQYDGIPTTYVDAHIKVTAPAGTKGLYDGDTEIRVRGNSTATLPKRPFKLKLDKKDNLLGIDKEGKSKHWVLLANAKDPTLMRNKLLMDFSEAIGTEAYISSENVTLIYNGEYCGVYELSEHVRVGETRVNVFDWEEYAEDVAEKIANETAVGADADRIADEIETRMLTDWSWMRSGKVSYNGKIYDFVSDLGMDKLPSQTGGFLLEMDFYAFNNGELASTRTAYAQPLYFNTPEPVGWDSLNSFYSTELYGYAYRYVQSFEYALHSDDFFYRDSDDHYAAENWWNKWEPRVYTKMEYSDPANSGKHYSELFDMDNLVENFIFCEIAMNWDSMKNSFFVYKDIDDLAKIGPQWDFDWAWGNVLWNSATWAPESWHCRDQVFMQEQYYQEVQWNCLLIRDPYFVTKVYEAWEKMRDDQIETLVGKGGTIDSYSSYIRRSALANDSRWAEIMAGYNSYSGEYYFPNYEEELVRMKDFVSTRMAWLDRQFTDVNTLIRSLGVYRSSPGKMSEPKVDVSGNKANISCAVSDQSIKYIRFQINGTIVIDAEVKNGTASVSVDTSRLDKDGYNCVVAYACDGGREYIVDEAHSDIGNYRNIVSNFKSFKLS